MTTHHSPEALPDYLTAGLDWHKAVLANWGVLQRIHWETLAAWQTAVEAFNQDLFDQWVCRFGGGVPLDG
jgi:hypothetical protein